MLNFVFNKVQEKLYEDTCTKNDECSSNANLTCQSINSTNQCSCLTNQWWNGSSCGKFKLEFNLLSEQFVDYLIINYSWIGYILFNMQ